MIIPCFRCGKELNSPDTKNADYVIAEDTKSDEPREVFIALRASTKTEALEAKGEEVADADYDRVEIASLAEAKDAVKVTSEIKIKTIQKTGIICPNCYKPTDFVIWGVHKR